MIVLISLLLNIGHETYYFCFIFFFSVGFFSAKYQKEMPNFLFLFTVLYFILLVSFLLNIGQKLNKKTEWKIKQHKMSFKRLIMSFFQQGMF